jgi:hypothetical protein
MALIAACAKDVCSMLAERAARAMSEFSMPEMGGNEGFCRFLMVFALICGWSMGSVGRKFCSKASARAQDSANFKKRACEQLGNNVE